jgi:Putative esterase
MSETTYRWTSWVWAALLAAPLAATELALRVEGGGENAPRDGRALLLLSTDDTAEPRFQIRPSVGSMQVFGVDFEGLAAGGSVVIDEAAVGWPVRRWADLPAGDYWVQGLVNRYERFELASGHSVLLPPDRGEGQHWNLKPGNPYSTPQRLRIDPAGDGRIEIVLDRVIEPIEPPSDTKYVRHIRMKSALLTEFWGRDVYLGAHVLVPEGFDEHPEARYPLMIFHGHFPDDFGGFRTEPPDPELPCEYSERFHVDCYNRIQQEEAYAFFQEWTAPGFPRYLALEIQHANPYYDDSYAVNSENLGPYGDAITRELVPFIERQFRGLGESWARFLYGGSTGGWEALAAQVLYPDDYNGCFAACPDPIDFRAYMTANIYEDANAYRQTGPFGSVERPGHRNWLGHVDATIGDFNHYELALGTKNRSGDQFDIWEAVYSPQGEDGYPRRLWDKESGEIDSEVAAFWRDNYDLGHILRRDWQTLGPKLAGKIHIYCGDMDNYYLNDAVYLVEEFLEGTTDPPYAGQVDYGDRAEHCWNGDHENGNHISRLRYNTMYLPKILKRIEESAPPGADLTSWRY